MGFYNNRGFSLIEILAVVSIAIGLFSLAMPLFASLQAETGMTVAVNQLLGQLYLARSSAVTREARIILCPAGEDRTCGDDYTQWVDGVMVFEDKDGDSHRSDDEPVISWQKVDSTRIRIRTSSQYRTRIAFLPQGRAWLSNTVFRVCDRKASTRNRAIIVSNNGRVRVSDSMSDGGRISCE